MQDFSQKEEDDEEDENSNISNRLEKFRETWRAELQDKRINTPIVQDIDTPSKNVSQSQESVYERAKELFQNGVWCEQNGLTFEAMEHYRKATKLVPDIDLHMAALYHQSHKVTDAIPAIEDVEEPKVIEDLCHHFLQLCSERYEVFMYCKPAELQKATHVSSLPGELLTNILYWVVSSDLDVRSLEQFSMVCRGFYVLARDFHIWQTICSKIWGSGCLTYLPFSSWRHMFIERPHLYFNGVYMSKVEFLRQGEATLEKFYPPWMKVTYFRYLRFFHDGLMFMYTSANDPAAVVTQLKSRKAALEGMCKGMYRIKEDNYIACILKRVKSKEHTKAPYRRSRNRNASPQESECTFFLELSLHNSGNRPNSLLNWEKYSVSIYYPDKQNEIINEFNLTKQDFPGLHFARVKSYTSEADAPLRFERDFEK